AVGRRPADDRKGLEGAFRTNRRGSCPMTSTGFKSPWQGVWSLDEIVNRRIRRPRTAGVTMVIDTGLGASSLRDLLDLAGDHIDHWKFGFGTSALMPLSVLEEKLDLLDQRHILTY